MMGGRMWVESGTERGSRFYFTAAFTLATAGTPAASPTGVHQLAGLPVLVVDDNATNRDVITEMLQNWQMRPHAVTNAEAALAELARAAAGGQPFRIVMLDALMPGQDGFALAGQIRQRAELAGTLIMMLASADCADDAARCRALGIDTYLTKPVCQSELFDAVASSLSPRPSSDTAFLRAPRAAPAPRPLRILLAEDNPVNRELAVALLNELGHSVEIAANGHAVLAWLEQSTFDVILMDLQMPGLDGLAATREIRRRELARAPAGAPPPHQPIIALTAHAMKGDREACLAAGMDEYVAKPIREPELVAALNQIVPASGPAAEPERSPTPPLDRARLLAGLNGNVSLLKRMAAVYFEHTPTLVAEIRDAIAANQPTEVFRAAHTLTGSLTQFAAGPAMQCAAKLEAAAREGMADLSAPVSELERELERFNRALEELTAEK